jgi:hypothetical protein
MRQSPISREKAACWLAICRFQRPLLFHKTVWAERLNGSIVHIFSVLIT